MATSPSDVEWVRVVWRVLRRDGGSRGRREPMLRTAPYVNSVFAAHALVLAAHGAFHAGHGVPFFPPQRTHVAPPLLAAPVGAALVFLRTQLRRVGAWLLLARRSRCRSLGRSHGRGA
jgi:hypothetical protein